MKPLLDSPVGLILLSQATRIPLEILMSENTPETPELVEVVKEEIDVFKYPQGSLANVHGVRAPGPYHSDVADPADSVEPTPVADTVETVPNANADPTNADSTTTPDIVESALTSDDLAPSSTTTENTTVQTADSITTSTDPVTTSPPLADTPIGDAVTAEESSNG